MSGPSPLSTPKRKRGQITGDGGDGDAKLLLDTTGFCFGIPENPQEEGSDSPRTKIAHRFRGLALEGVAENRDVADESVSAAPEPEGMKDCWDCMDEDTSTRKRVKYPEESKPRTTSLEYGIDDAAQLGPVDFHVFPRPIDNVPLIGPKGEWETGLEVPSLDPAVVKSSEKGSGCIPRLQKSYPSINRLSESKSRKRRAGTPPLAAGKAVAGASHSGNATDGDTGSEARIVDPVRAALTWHEDEITVYDPEDEDDDGTGINGIGFKPTPAIAYSRMMRRKQQLAEYRKREDKDARARRSQRRRGSPNTIAVESSHDAERRVRFMDAKATAVAMTS